MKGISRNSHLTFVPRAISTPPARFGPTLYEAMASQERSPEPQALEVRAAPYEIKTHKADRHPTDAPEFGAFGFVDIDGDRRVP